jgi:hypothetical protein
MMPTPTSNDEVAFISGVNANGTLPLDAFAAWNSDNPATYTGGFTESYKWGPDTAATPGGTISYYFDPASNWNATEEQSLSAGLALWSAIANINFVQTTNASQAQITFDRGSDSSAETSSTLRDTSPNRSGGVTGGSTLLTPTQITIMLDTNIAGFGPIDGSFSTFGGYPIMTLLHEEGHAIGLGHAGPYNGTVDSSTQQFSPYDSRLWSIMSYIDPTDTSAEYYNQYSVTGTEWGFSAPNAQGESFQNVPTTWMPLDILSAQALYGLPTSTPLSGGQTFGFNSNIVGPIEPFFDFTKNTTPVITIWDEGTGNTLDLSGFNTPSTVNLNPGTFSSADGMTNNIAIAFNTAVDTLVLGPTPGFLGADIDNVTCNNDGDSIYCSTTSANITGGAGNDTIYWTAPVNDVLGLTVDGGGGWNRVVLSAPSTDFSWDVGQNGILELEDLSTHIDNDLTHIGELVFSNETVAVTPSNDFNGDLYSDILWQNDNGQAAIWEMKGFNQLEGQPVGGDPGSNWKVVASADINGDGNADIIWQDTDNGQVVVWTMNGFSQTGSAFVGNAPGADWKMVGTGDFAGNGQEDPLFQNDTNGQAVIWTMSGTSQTSSTFIGGAPGSNWKIAGTGDFNGDGDTDLVWQDGDNGQVVIWTMNGTTQTGSDFVGAAPGAAWQVEGVGDFFGDGQANLLFQNTSTGQAVIWTMDGTTQTGSTFIGGDPGPSWHIEGVGNYNGDGKADILWQNDNGQAAIWTMNGTTQLAGSPVGGNPGTSWHIPAGVG